jgi:hypothetical protein
VSRRSESPPTDLDCDLVTSIDRGDTVAFERHQCDWRPYPQLRTVLRPFWSELVISDAHHIIAQQQFLILSFL